MSRASSNKTDKSRSLYGKKRIRTTYRKLTMAFLLCGMLPLLIFGMIFMWRMQITMRDSAVDNYTQVTNNFVVGVENILDSAENVFGILYDYEADDVSLTDALKSSTMSDADKELFISYALETGMEGSSFVSSIRLVDSGNNIYSLYYDQRKTLREDAADMMGFDTEIFTEENLHERIVFPTIPESLLCVDSEDYIFVLARSYMDTSSVQSANETVLARVYLDINIEEIENLLVENNVEDKTFYIYNPSDGNYMFLGVGADYNADAGNPLGDYEIDYDAGSGSLSVRGGVIFYQQIEDTGQYAVLVLENEEIYGGSYRSALLMVLILLFFCFVLIIFYMWFSNSLSAPILKLQRGMEQIKAGNLDARFELDTNDEMEYVADGLNDMLDELQSYINRVYVAGIETKEAELNALKMQIQPHYLYNTLDVIRMTALDHDDEETAELLESLAVTLRYVMGKHDDMIPLGEELNMLGEYFVIMRARYQGRIGLHISVPEEDKKLLVPKLVLQPVVENAIKHGLRPKKGPGTVEVSTSRSSGDLYISVLDDGVGMPQEIVSHMMDILENADVGYRDPEGHVSIGTKNVYDRIRMLCGPGYGFTIMSEQGIGTVVTFRLPLIEEEEKPDTKDENPDTEDTIQIEEDENPDTEDKNQ